MEKKNKKIWNSYLQRPLKSYTTYQVTKKKRTYFKKCKCISAKLCKPHGKNFSLYTPKISISDLITQYSHLLNLMGFVVPKSKNQNTARVYFKKKIVNFFLFVILSNMIETYTKYNMCRTRNIRKEEQKKRDPSNVARVWKYREKEYMKIAFSKNIYT